MSTPSPTLLILASDLRVVRTDTSTHDRPHPRNANTAAWLAALLGGSRNGKVFWLRRIALGFTTSHSFRPCRSRPDVVDQKRRGPDAFPWTSSRRPGSRLASGVHSSSSAVDGSIHDIASERDTLMNAPPICRLMGRDSLWSQVRGDLVQTSCQQYLLFGSAGCRKLLIVGTSWTVRRPDACRLGTNVDGLVGLPLARPSSLRVESDPDRRRLSLGLGDLTLPPLGLDGCQGRRKIAESRERLTLRVAA